MHNAPDWNPTFTKLQPPTATNLRIRSVHDAHKLFHAVYLEKLPMVVRRLDAEERKLIKSGDVHVWEERGPSTEGLGLGIERWTDGKLWGPSRVRDNFLFYHEKEREPADFHGGSKWAKMLSGGVVVFRRRSRGEGGPNAYTGALTQTLDASGNPMGMEMGVLHPNEQPQSPYGEQMYANEYGTCHKDRLVKQTYSVLVKLPKERGGVEVRKWHMTAYFTAPSPNPSRPLRTVDDIPFLRDLEIPDAMYQPARVGRGMGRHRSTVGLDPTGSGQSRGVHIPSEDEDPSSTEGSVRDMKDNIDHGDVNDPRSKSDISLTNGAPVHATRQQIIQVHTSRSHLPVASPSNSMVSKSGQPTAPPPPSLSIATMPVVPSQPPALSLALHHQPSPSTTTTKSNGGLLHSPHPNVSPPPPSSPSARSILSYSEPSTSRRGGSTRTAPSQRFSPYNQHCRLNTNPPSPVSASPRTSSEWNRDVSYSSSSSSCGKVQLPPLSCVAFDRHPSHRLLSESTPSSLTSASRSRSSSLSEAASSITQSLQTPRTNTPPRSFIGGGLSSSLSSRGFAPFTGSSLKSDTMASPIVTLNEKPKNLVPLAFLENIRSTQSSQYSLPIPYGPGAISARRAVDQEILKGLPF